MDPKKSLNITEFADIFQSNILEDRRKFLFYFEQFAKLMKDYENLSLNINEIVPIITENLLNSCSSNVGDLKFETIIFSIPWSRFIYPEKSSENCLNFEIFCKFLIEYIQIFPNKCEKFFANFIFLLRGNPNCVEQLELKPQELLNFSLLKNTISFLLKNITNFERVLTKLLKSRFPFVQNTTGPHPYLCYCYNYVAICDLVSQESAADLFEHLFVKILQIDLRQFFDELAEYGGRNKENNNSSLLFEFEIDVVDSAIINGSSADPYRLIDNGEHRKKVQILDATFKILFDYIDAKPLPSDGSIFDDSESCPNYHLKIFTTIFFQHLLSSESLHVQYLIFYICAKSGQFCEALVNDLWVIATSSSMVNSLTARQGAVSYLLSLLLNARFVNLRTIFSFLKILLQWLNGYLDTHPSAPESLTDNDTIYYVLCTGFCRLFCAFHLELDRIHIDCLKNMDLKRAIFNSWYSPLQFMQAEMRDQFVQVINYYRIGYSNLNEIKPRRLTQVSVNYRENPSSFGSVYLQVVRSKIQPLVRNVDQLNCLSSSSRTHSLTTHSSPLKHESSFRTRHKSGYNLNCRESMKSTPSSSSIFAAIATSPSSTDDALISPSNNSLTPSTSFIMNQMLSDMETN